MKLNTGIFATNYKYMGLLHIHEVLDIIYNSDKIFTIEELKQEVINIFGDDISFTSCADHEFEINDMVDFMLQRGKIQLQGDKIYPYGEACGH
jgi:probable metal-binding protein